jgi:protein O-GlcNAc transferase
VTPNLVLERARHFHRAGNLAAAADLYRQVLRIDPRHGEALYALGVIHVLTGRFEPAQRRLEEALAREPGFLDAEAWRGVALLNLRRHEEAIACFDRVLSARPDDAGVLSNRATALFELERLDDALAAFDAVLAVDPGHAVSWNNRGNLLLKLKRHVEALESYDRALAAQPNFGEARLNRLRLFRLAVDDTELGDFLRGRAQALLAQGAYAEALAAFDDSLLAAPHSAEAFAGRGAALAGLGRGDEAQKWFTIALHIDPDCAPARAALLTPASGSGP